MPKLSRYIFAISLALPISALAKTVTIVTRAAGTVTPDSVTLSTLGIASSGNEAQPYELVIKTVFDSDQTVYDSNGFGVYANEVDADIEFRFGAMTYRYTGPAVAQAEVYAAFGGREGYHQTVDLYAAGSPYDGPSLRFNQWSFGPPGTFGDGDPLAPRVYDTTDGAMLINAYPYAPDYWRMTDSAGIYSVQVQSAVPEPGPIALLIAGVAILGLWGRFQLQIKG